MCKGQVVKLMGPLCRAGSILSLFSSVRSFTRPVNLSLSVSYFYYTTEAFSCCFDLVSPHFQLSHFAFPSSRSACLASSPFSPSIFFFFSPAFVFLSLSASIAFLSLLLFRRMLGRREQSSLKYQKTDQEAPLVPLLLRTLPPLF